MGFQELILRAANCKVGHFPARNVAGVQERDKQFLIGSFREGSPTLPIWGPWLIRFSHMDRMFMSSCSCPAPIPKYDCSFAIAITCALAKH